MRLYGQTDSLLPYLQVTNLAIFRVARECYTYIIYGITAGAALAGPGSPRYVMP